MSEMFPSSCVLCDAEAQFEYKNANEWKYFKCPLCGYFIISLTAIGKLDHAKKSALAKASAALSPHEDKILFITYRSGDGLCWEAVPRATYGTLQ